MNSHPSRIWLATRALLNKMLPREVSKNHGTMQIGRHKKRHIESFSLLKNKMNSYTAILDNSMEKISRSTLATIVNSMCMTISPSVSSINVKTVQS